MNEAQEQQQAADQAAAQNAQEEQKPMVFESEEARGKALQELPDTPPPDVDDIEAWEAQQEILQRRIEEGKIAGQEGAAEQAGDSNAQVADPSQAEQTGNRGGESDTGYNADDWTVNYKGERITIAQEDIPKDRRFTFKNVKDALGGYVDTQRYMDKLRSDHTQQTTSLKADLQKATETQADLQKQIDELKQGGQKQELPEGIPTDQQIEDARVLVENLENEIDQLDEDDPSGFQKIRDLRKKEKAYGSLRDKRDGYAREQAAKDQKERDEAATAEKTRKDESDARKAELTRRRSAMGDFVKNVDDFKTTTPWQEIERQSTDFGFELASVYYNKPVQEVTWPMFEAATQEYLRQTPAFLKKLKDAGFGPTSPLHEPEDFRTYLVTSEVELLQRGKRLNPETGVWEDVVVSGQKVTHPDMQSAYDYWKRLNGVRAQERISDMDRGASEILRAIQQSGAIEISSQDAGPQRQHVQDKMGYEDAVKNYSTLEKQAREAGYAQLEEWIESIEQTNPGDPRAKMWDECVTVMEAAVQKK